MISNINAQSLKNSAIETNKTSTTQTTNGNQSSLKQPVEKSTAATPATIVNLGATNAAEPSVTYSFRKNTSVVTPPVQASSEYSAAGTSGNIGKPPPSPTQQSPEYEIKPSNIDKSSTTQAEEPVLDPQGTSGNIGKPPP